MTTLLLAMVGSTAAFAAPDLSVAYHGHVITHPGASVRAAWPLGESRVHLQPEVEGGAWVHPRHQLALFGRGGLALAHRGKRGGRHALFAHVGGQRSTWLVPTVRVGDDGELSQRALAGQWWGTVTAGVELGRNRWFTRPQLSWRGPYFHGLGTDFAVQVGVQL